MLFEKGPLQNTKWKDTKINFKTTGGGPSQNWAFPGGKTMLCVLCKSIQC